MNQNKFIHVKEVGPRDGLQNISSIIPTEKKIDLIHHLISCGISYIEVTAFVSPKSIPQMADSMEVAKRLPINSNVTFGALVPNMKGLESALAFPQIREIAVFTAASETFNKKNINATIEESFCRFEPVVAQAVQKGLLVRGYVSTAFVCPYEGLIQPEKVIPVVDRLIAMGCHEVSIGDTIGKANPEMIHRLWELLEKRGWISRIAGHFHDTFHQALANVEAAMSWGTNIFDTSVAGIGGCPYAPGASGNLSTNVLVSFLHEKGYETGISVDQLSQASQFVNSSILAKSL